MNFQQFAVVALVSVPVDQVTPNWLVKHGLIREEDVEKISISNKQESTASYKFETFHLHIDSQRLQVSTEDRTAIPLMFDIFEGIFTVHSSALIRAIGTNVATHYDVESEKEWHRVGHKMAIKEPWIPIMGENPGLVKIHMQGERSGGRIGTLNVTVEPSKRLKFGVYIHINQHVDIESDEANDDGVEYMFDVISEFKESLLRDTEAIDEYILR